MAHQDDAKKLYDNLKEKYNGVELQLREQEERLKKERRKCLSVLSSPFFESTQRNAVESFIKLIDDLFAEVHKVVTELDVDKGMQCGPTAMSLMEGQYKFGTEPVCASLHNLHGSKFAPSMAIASVAPSFLNAHTLFNIILTPDYATSHYYERVVFVLQKLDGMFENCNLHYQVEIEKLNDLYRELNIAGQCQEYQAMLDAAKKIIAEKATATQPTNSQFVMEQVQRVVALRQEAQKLEDNIKTATATLEKAVVTTTEINGAAGALSNQMSESSQALSTMQEAIAKLGENSQLEIVAAKSVSLDAVTSTGQAGVQEVKDAVKLRLEEIGSTLNQAATWTSTPASSRPSGSGLNSLSNFFSSSKVVPLVEQELQASNSVASGGPLAESGQQASISGAAKTSLVEEVQGTSAPAAVSASRPTRAVPLFVYGGRGRF